MGSNVVINISGKKFGDWKVLSYYGIKHTNAYWHCKCKCGNTKIVCGSLLRKGKSSRCQACSGRINGKKGHKHRKHLYLIKCGRYIKIGSTDNIKIRLSSLQTYNPFSVKLLHYFENKGKLENILHSKFKNKIKHGEWFKLNDKDIKYILNLTKGVIWIK